MSINRTPKTWGSEVLTSTDLNAEVNDLWDGLQAAWDTYTPAWTSNGSAPSIGNGSISGKYYRVGKTVKAAIEITIGTTTVVGTGFYGFSLPVACARTTYFPVGVGIVADGTTAQYMMTAIIITSTAVGLINASGARATYQSPFSIASTDKILINVTYEAS